VANCQLVAEICYRHGGGGPGARLRVRGVPANRARWSNRGAPSLAPPPPHLRGCVAAPAPVESRPGGVARGARLRGPVRGPVPAPRGS